MKKYSKYKDFIPKDFIVTKETKNGKSDKIGIIALLFLNCYLLPHTIDSILYSKEIKESITFVEDFSYNNAEIFRWLTLCNDPDESLTVKDGIAELVLKNDDNLENIEESGFIIKKVTMEDNNIVVNLEGVNNGEE